ncbi:MAG: zinc-binding dehydrogenase [Chloroflexota bacterium]
MKGKTIRYLDDGGLDVIEVEVPAPGHGEVQVQGGVCGVCAWDLYTFHHGAKAPSAAPPGHEGMGTVVALGPDVRGLAVGDKVAGGGFATLRNLKAASVYRLPPCDLPDEQWMVEPVSCVVTGVDHCDLKIGDRVAVVGCGFMGLLLLQCLVGSFAEQVIAIDVDAHRLELADAYGADEVLNPRDSHFAARIAELRALGIDTVVDASGTQAGLDTSFGLVRRGGRINLFGWIHGPATAPGSAWHGGGYTVVASSPSAKLRDTFPVAIRLIEVGMVDLSELVTHVVPLDEMATLLRGATTGEVKDYVKGVIRLE